MTMRVYLRVYFRAACAGLAAAMLMRMATVLCIRTGLAPFDVPPEIVFLESMVGLSPQWATGFHLLYGMAWPVALQAVAKGHLTLRRGMLLGLGLWLIMMTVLSPALGWGFFGLNAAAQQLTEHERPGPGDPMPYMVVTLLLNLLYGMAVGWLNPLWRRIFRDRGVAHTKSAFTEDSR